MNSDTHAPNTRLGPPIYPPVQTESRPRRLRYHVAYSCTTTSLKHEVENYLSDGWELLGGVSVSPVPGAPTERQIFAQAMTKWEEQREVIG